MKHIITVVAGLGFCSLAQADLGNDVRTLCNADPKMTPAQCDCQVTQLTDGNIIDQRFMGAMVEGLKNGNTEPLMQLMQNDQEGANKFGQQLEEIAKGCAPAQ